MRENLHVRRVLGLTLVFLGLAAVFGSLTLVAVSRPRVSAVFAITGAAMTVIGLWWLARTARRAQSASPHGTISDSGV